MRGARSSLRLALEVMIVMTLTVSCGSKLLHVVHSWGKDDQLHTYELLAIMLETSIVVAFCIGWRVMGCFATIALAIGAVLISTGQGSCRCFGEVFSLSEAGRQTVACSLGVSAGSILALGTGDPE